MKFRLVDRILQWNACKNIRGVKTVSFEEYELRRPLGEAPFLPESLLVESLFQLGNWLIMLSTDFNRMGLVVRWEEIQFLDQLRPGGSLTLDAEVRSWRADGVVFDGLAKNGADLIAVGRGCLATPVALDGFFNPDDMRTLYSEIYRPISAADEEKGIVCLD